MNWKIKTSLLFLLLATSAVSTLIKFVPPIVTLSGIISVPFLIYTWLSDLRDWKLLFLITVTFVTAAALTTLNGVLHGWDSWLYVGSSKIIEAQGWSPDGSSNVNAHQFPGIQFTTVLIVKMAGIKTVSVAKYLPILLKISPILFFYLIVRGVAGNRRLALLGPILLISFTPFIVWLPYHHITYGFVVSFPILYMILVPIVEDRREPLIDQRSFTIVGLLLTGLLISHQFSMFQVMVLIGLTVAIHTGSYFLVNNQINVSYSMVMLWITFFSASLLYYLWVGNTYFVNIIEIQSSFSNTVLAEPIPIVEQTLEPVNTGGGRSSLPVGLNSRRKILNLIGILLFSFSAVVVLSDLLIRTSPHKRLNEVNIPAYVAFGYVGTYGAFRSLGALGIGLLGGTRRIILSSLPFAIAGILAIETSRERRINATRVGGVAIVVIVLALSTAIFPGYLLTENGIPSTDDDQTNRIYLTSERRSTYEWTRYGSHAQVDTQGMLYINGMVRTTQTYVYPRVYAGDFDVVPEGTLLIIAESYKRRIPMRGHPFEYRLTSSLYKSYAATPKLQRVYDSGQSEVYKTRETA